MKPLRILFVGMPDSVHTARWINNLADLGWDIHLFAASPGIPHHELRNVTIYNLSFARPQGLHRSVRVKGLWPLRIGVERLSAKVSYSTWLAKLIRWLKPEILHSMEIQRAGYITLEAKSKLKGEFPPWIVTNWGSDIYLFGRLAEHAEKIRAVMQGCDYYHCECHRDVNLAREFGFEGQTLPVFPVAGGFDLEWMRGLRQPGPTSARRTIALKGYQTWAGRALVGLRALAPMRWRPLAHRSPVTAPKRTMSPPNCSASQPALGSIQNARNGPARTFSACMGGHAFLLA